MTVVVVGAGYAGLAAALALTDAGRDVVVLEAADRVGGRVLTEVRPDGLRLDHGGQWVGPTQRHLLALAERFGCATYPTFEDGTHTEIWRDGSSVPFTAAAPETGPGVAEYERVAGLLDRLSETVDLDRPWETPRFAELDAQTAESFFRMQTSDEDAILRLSLSVQGLWCAEPREISLFHVLFYLASGGGYENLMETGGHAQDSRFADGAMTPALAVARHLGDRVRLGEPVLSVAQGERVTVTTTAATYAADRVVVTLPPATLGRVGFDPVLPVDRRGWVAHLPMGRVAKVHAVYDRPFWRERGLSGIASIYDDGPVGVVFDNSPADASAGVLVGFVYGDRVSSWSALDADARRASVLASLANVVGPDALAARDYTEKIWPLDPWAVGGYEAYATPGAWTGYARQGWRTPFGRVHWAGTETASRWNGYIDGALESGYRAAAEILEGK